MQTQGFTTMDVQEQTITNYLLARFNAIYEAVANAGNDGITAAEIAKAIGLKKSKYLMDLLDRMIQAEWIRREFIDGRYKHYRYFVG